MWFLNQYDTDSAAYNLPFALRLDPRPGTEIDRAALAASVLDVLTRHEVLRTYYPDRGVGPEQVIVPASEVLPSGVDVLTVRAADVPAFVACAVTLVGGALWSVVAAGRATR